MIPCTLGYSHRATTSVSQQPCSLCSSISRRSLVPMLHTVLETARSTSRVAAGGTCQTPAAKLSAFKAGYAKRKSRQTVAAGTVDAAERTAAVGDTVTVHFTVIGEDGEKLESSRDSGQALTFEVGASDIIGNDLLQAFDGGVRGLAVGSTRRVQLEPLQEEWSQDLLFPVPRDHQEVQRLEGKFRSSGGLQEGMIVELANGAQAQVLKITDEAVIFDANSATAGRKVAFDIELVSIE